MLSSAMPGMRGGEDGSREPCEVDVFRAVGPAVRMSLGLLPMPPSLLCDAIGCVVVC